MTPLIAFRRDVQLSILWHSQQPLCFELLISLAYSLLRCGDCFRNCVFLNNSLPCCQITVGELMSLRFGWPPVITYSHLVDRCSAKRPTAKKWRSFMYLSYAFMFVLCSYLLSNADSSSGYVESNDLMTLVEPRRRYRSVNVQETRTKRSLFRSSYPVRVS
jgi:hypothetical protein